MIEVKGEKKGCNYWKLWQSWKESAYLDFLTDIADIETVLNSILDKLYKFKSNKITMLCNIVFWVEKNKWFWQSHPSCDNVKRTIFNKFRLGFGR